MELFPFFLFEYTCRHYENIGLLRPFQTHFLFKSTTYESELPIKFANLRIIVVTRFARICSL